ncbi:acyl-CoA dehydrogenase family protein [Nocardia seriolae]|uniref:Acyl-CoA dehydrogenase n=1 Tax=Nocardia seriolae TaxID=37332 RepID=A0ABC9YNW2_9NOCA|nr:acyl-CoA dehydrogenase family protein [Nocardia seriolae]OJF77940.1 acyl-CoA dehydrogenase [Nocardia seriolae]PSK32327.1 acyl-CoA dehydrogenase [Nocardia seriolae]QOW31860.1 acyl-CoA/acyl-ACP dehydrogenase [Nocardia seriolae]QUN19468.1 acyl-CoA/acyl-ACP dehydrogenase [Nocardia seriolae]RLP32703.1 acyl-CoA dehydrogenase [Nocardia seriolae]
MSQTLFNPKTCEFTEFDAETRRLLRATVDYFEAFGKVRLLAESRDRVWYADFLDFIKRERVFAIFLTPAEQAGGDSNKRWDTARIAMMSKILGFYGMQYWYVWQVTILGLGPIWQSHNAEAKARAAALLESGEIFAFGLSEQDHGADIYSTDMVLEPKARGGYTATGGKYYIGNGNLAGMVSVFGRRADKPIIDSSDFMRKMTDEEYSGYLFFAADSRHKSYKLRKNVVDSQMYVAAFDLDKYPVAESDILHTGRAAFDAAMNTVNVGKFNLGFGAVGSCEHAMFEAVTHAHNRILFGHRVTEFPQVKSLLADSYARLIGMKLYSERAIDYMRSADENDRRYLLFNAIEKMSVTRNGQRLYEDLADVIAARGFENDMYFPMAMVGMFGLPRLEGTVHVNMALSLKFMPNFMCHPADAALAALRYLPGAGVAPKGAVRAVSGALSWTSRHASGPAAKAVPALKAEFARAAHAPVPTRRDAADDEFLFRQGPSSGLGKIRFADWRPVFEKFAHIPNVAVFLEQALAFQTLLAAATPTAEQQQDVDFLFALGELFTTLPYAQLILEQAEIAGADEAVLDQLFDLFVREFSKHALTLHTKPTATKAQQVRALDLVRRPAADPARFGRVLTQVTALAGAYEMNP